MVSSKDVARHAGVSQTTVSRVLNTPELVKQKTMDKVLKAIEELNYIPNEIARSLVQKKTKVITLISGPLHNPFFVDSTTEIVNYANRRGYKVNVYFGADDNLESIYSAVLEAKTDAIILSSILFDDPLYDQLELLGIPFITFNRKHKKNERFVELDNERAGRLAAEHILSLGHKDVCWIGGPQTMSTFFGRHKGFMEAMRGESDQGEASLYFTDTSKEEIHRVMNEIVSQDRIPTAICAATDAIALEVIDFCLNKGFCIPEDFSVIGIDNVELSKHHAINLTTVGTVSGKNLGLTAIEKLFDSIESESACIRQTESVKLFLRKTTGKNTSF